MLWHWMMKTNGSIKKGDPIVPTLLFDKKKFGLHEVDRMIRILNRFKTLNKEIKINSKGQSINDSGELILFNDSDVIR